jgi:hypothetical protein
MGKKNRVREITKLYTEGISYTVHNRAIPRAGGQWYVESIEFKRDGLTDINNRNGLHLQNDRSCYAIRQVSIGEHQRDSGEFRLIAVPYRSATKIEYSETIVEESDPVETPNVELQRMEE